MSLVSSMDLVNQYPFLGWDWYMDWSGLYIFAFCVPAVVGLVGAVSHFTYKRREARLAARNRELRALHEARWAPWKHAELQSQSAAPAQRGPSRQAGGRPRLDAAGQAMV